MRKRDEREIENLFRLDKSERERERDEDTRETQVEEPKGGGRFSLIARFSSG